MNDLQGIDGLPGEKADKGAKGESGLNVSTFSGYELGEFANIYLRIELGVRATYKINLICFTLGRARKTGTKGGQG